MANDNEYLRTGDVVPADVAEPRFPAGRCDMSRVPRTFYVHLECDGGWDDDLEKRNVGGVTLSVETRDQAPESLEGCRRVDVGVAFCAPGDQYSRSRGRIIADGRRNKWAVPMSSSRIRTMPRAEWGAQARAANGILQLHRFDADDPLGEKIDPEHAAFAFIAKDGDSRNLTDQAIDAFDVWIWAFHGRPLWTGRVGGGVLIKRRGAK